MPPVLRAAALAGLLAATAARAADDDARWRLDAGVPVDLVGGHTTYEIWAADASSSVRSRLAFPLQGVAAGIHARLAAPRSEDGGRWTFEASLQHTLGDAAGTLEDSDWIDGVAETSQVGSSHPGLDIYSTSRASLSAVLFDGRVSWEHAVTPALRLAPLAGVLYQSFSFVVTDVNQVGYGPWAAGYTGSTTGRVLTYDARYTAVYVGGRGALARGRFAGTLDAWYSPFARASDEDDHLLRGKLSRTEADGHAWQLRGEGRVALGPVDELSLQASVVAFRVTGTQTQTFYAGPDAGTSGVVDAKLTSLRWTAGLAWTRRFR